MFQEGTSDILSIVKFGEAPENKAVYTIKVSDVLSCLATKKVIILRPGPKVMKLFFMLSSTEHEIYHTHKC